MSPLANLLSRGKEEQDASVDVSDLSAPRPVLVAKVNLLPPEIAEAERFRREQVVRLAAVVAAVAVVGVLAVGANGQVSDAQAAADAETARTSALQAQVASLSEVPQTAAELKTAQAQVTGALGAEVRWSQYLNNLGIVTGPLDSQIQTMTVTQTVDPPTNAAAGPVSYTGIPGIATVTYAGQAKSNDAVSYFLDALAKQKGNVDPSFSAASAATDPKSDREVVTFTANVTVTDQAESGRYSTGG